MSCLSQGVIRSRRIAFAGDGNGGKEINKTTWSNVREFWQDSDATLTQTIHALRSKTKEKEENIRDGEVVWACSWPGALAERLAGE